MSRISATQAGGTNVTAFLDMIAASEIGAWLLSHSDDGYNVLVGAHGPLTRNGQTIPAKLLTFASYATHPNVLNTACNSTAAGRYQLLYRYYAPYAKLLGLKDFSPVSQDLIALQQIKECRAIPLIQAGQITAAIRACAHIWASLPGNNYGQGANSLSMLTAAWQTAGGKVALA